MLDDSSPDDLDFGQTIQIPRFGPGQKIFRRYILQKILGRGGMGVVWLARDEQLETLVAIKLLPETLCHDRVSLHDLKRETKLGLHLAHPNIVRIYDFQQDDNAAAISMEYVDGATLSEVRITKPQQVFNPADLCPYIEALCDALHYAHSRVKIVHRDLKPRNLMLNREGELKIADFGISRSITESMTMMTGKLGSAGSPPYISPQQWDGDPPTPVDDIYSVGATLYELLTSKPPFMGVVDWQQVHEKIPPPIWKRRADLGIKDAAPIPAEWEEAIAACLAKNPKDRPQTVRELQARLTISGEVPADIPETNAAPAISLGSAVTETIDSSEDDFFAEVTLRDISNGTAAIATARTEPKVDAPTTPIHDSAAPASEPVLSKNSPPVEDHVIPKHLSKETEKTPLAPSDTEAAAKPSIAEEPAPPLTPSVAPLEFVSTDKGAPTIADTVFPSTAMEGPEAIRRGPTKVPRWVWAGAIATILLLCGIFIWRKPSNLQPAPTPSPFADLLIESEPSGADLTLDGGPPARTPHTFKDLKFGPHRLTMALDGYSPVERGIEFSGSSLPKIVLEPKPPEEIAKLTIRSDPPGASIRLDGTLPQEPNTFTNVKFGEHRLTAVLEGFEPKEQVLIARREMRNDMILKLDRAKPTPSRDLLQSLLAEHRDSEAARDWPKYRAVSLELLGRLTRQGEPASKEHREILTTVIEGLRTKGPALTNEEFRAYEENLKYAAQLDIVPAILVVADKLRARNSPDAFNWYYYAAEAKHVSYAMTKIAWLYWLGECGRQADKAEGFKWFKLAGEAGDADARTIVGECYLRGDGTAKDEDAGIGILLPLAKLGVPHAKTLIGQCYYNGSGQFAKLTQQERNRMAKIFFEDAIQAGDWPACGHLGVMYEVGQGVPKDWKQAARLYLQGVEHENPICMYYYARALENHGPELTKMLDRQDKAETYYVKAAAASITEARRWCIEHNVKF